MRGEAAAAEGGLVSDGIGAMWRAGSPPAQRRRNEVCTVPGMLVYHAYGREGSKGGAALDRHVQQSCKVRTSKDEPNEKWTSDK